MNNFLATDQTAIGTDQKAIIINEKKIFGLELVLIEK